MAKAKPNQKFHVDKLNTALDALDKLETKPKEELSLRESIYFMRGKLNAALRKGYSYEDLSEILAEQEILVSAATLKLYLAEGSKGKSTRKKSKSNSSSKRGAARTTNVTNYQEDSLTSNSTDEINRMMNNKPTDKNQTKSLKAGSKAKKEPKTKSKILSGLDDDLSSDFNQY